MNKKIIQALKPFGFPIKADLYTGTEKKYFTFNYSDDRGQDFGDDSPGAIVSYMQIHLFMPMNENYLQLKKEIRMALFNAGFTFPIIEEANIPEENIRHLVYECEIESED